MDTDTIGKQSLQARVEKAHAVQTYAEINANRRPATQGPHGRNQRIPS